MEGSHVIKTGGWTAYSNTNMTTGASTANGQTANQTTPAAAASTTPDTTNQATTTPTATAISANDQFLFSNPTRLVGETLLTLAERYTNSEILKHIGLKPGTDQPVLAQSALSHRITSALEKRTKATNTTADQARAALRTARDSNNVLL